VACKVSRQAVSAWERGAASPNVLDLRELGMLLGVSLDYLVYGIRTVPLSHYRVLRDVFREPAPAAIGIETERSHRARGRSPHPSSGR
jgi:transcriptional regulator with XRE-family HTH domain